MNLHRSCFLAGVAIAVVGCTPQPKPVAPENASTEEKLQAVMTGFCEAASALRRSPTSDAELRPYLERFGPPDEILRSPGDNMPLMVNYKATSASHIVACQQQGQGGVRVAISLKGDITTISESDFQKLRSSPAYQPASSAASSAITERNLMSNAMKGKLPQSNKPDAKVPSP